jgi:predicted permease
MHTLVQDVRFAFRTLIKSPGFAAVAVLSLALGIGANTTIFSLVNTIFFRPLPVERPEELISIFTTDEKNPGPLPMSRPNAMDIAESNTSFSDVTHFSFATVALASGGEPEQVFGFLVSGNYFDVLGVKAALGRTFLPEENQTLGTHPVVLLSDSAWKRRFGADPSIVGKPITINNNAFTVIGVTPEGFRGTFIGANPQMFLPMMMYRQVVSGTFLEWFEERRPLLCGVIGRIKPGVSLDQAQADVQTIAKRLEKEYPEPNSGRGATLIPLNQSTMPPQARGVAIFMSVFLMVVVGLVLFIACANVANLLLARATGRRREIAVRLSLGAGRGRLIRQLLTESTILALISGAAGLLLAFWVRDLIAKELLPAQAGIEVSLPLDGLVLSFTLLVSLLTGVVFGLVPALQSTRPDVVDALKDQAGQMVGRRHRFKLRSLLVVLQVVGSLMALIGAGLFLRSLQNMHQLDPVFESQKLLLLNFDIGAQGYDQARGELFYRRVLDRVRALPGVETAALASAPPLGAGFMRTVFPEGEAEDRSKGVLTLVNNVGPGYFETVGIPILQGRAIAEADTAGAPPVVVVNETMAKRHWPDQDPIGKRFKFFGDTFAVEIVGVAKDSKYQNLGEDPQAFVYIALPQRHEAQVSLHVRTAADPEPLLNVVRREVQAFEPTMPLTGVETIGQSLRDNLQGPRTITTLLGIFGMLALGMASLGIYGVTAYSVSQRTREIGIRMALGAKHSDVLGLVLRQGMGLVLIGLGLGLGISLILARVAASQLADVLVGVKGTDLVTFGATALLLSGVALLATVLPARRAMRVNPIAALKYE